MKNIFKCILLSSVVISLLGCGSKKEEPITNKEESTIIKNAKNTDEFINKKDYKSIAYAFIYNIKEGLESYESETNGSIKAKVAFFDYNIKYNSITYKKGNVFYSKDHSTSTFSNINNEFYMTSKDKILVSRDLKKYDVYTLEEYKKVSYTPAQYTIMGYVFNNESIIKTDVISDQGDVINIKYTLDNELSTHIVKVDMKENGDLTGYPSYKNIEITLSMKKDFTPISYSIDAIYDASRAIIGTSTVTQHGECLFSNVNGNIVIPNETSLAEKLGAKPSEIIIDNTEQAIKDELNEAFKKLDFANGVNINGNLALNLFNEPIILNIDADALFDASRLSNEKIYNIFNFNAKLEGDETFNSLVSIIKSFAGDKLGEFEPLLNNFKSLEVVYDNEGGIYLVPTNNDDAHVAILKIKVTDIVDLLLKQINVYNLVNGANNDSFIFKKTNEVDKDNYKVELTLNEETLNSLREQINTLFENEQYAMIKTLLSYQDVDSVKIVISVTNGVISGLDASLNYVKKGENEKGEIVSLLTAHFDIKNQSHDYAPSLAEAKTLYEAYTSVSEIKARLNYLCKNAYVNKAYLEDLDKAYEEYEALSDLQKGFVGKDYKQEIENIKNDISNILLFLETYKKYDLSNLNGNQDIYDILKAYHLNSLNQKLLTSEIGEDNYSKLSNLSQNIDYTSFDSALSKMEGGDEKAWGLNEQEIKDIKLINDIAEIETSLQTTIWLKLLMGGKNMTFEVFKAKIDALYNGLNSH